MYLKDPVKRKLDITECMRMIFGRNCTNKLDRMFGVLGIIESGETFNVNYNWTYDEAILKFNEKIIKINPTIIFNHSIPKKLYWSWIFDPKENMPITTNWNKKSIKIKNIKKNEITFDNDFTISIPCLLIDCDTFCDKTFYGKNIRHYDSISYCLKLFSWCTKNKINMSLLISTRNKEYGNLSNYDNIDIYIKEQLNLIYLNEDFEFDHINNEQKKIILDIAFGIGNGKDFLSLIDINGTKYVYSLRILIRNNILNDINEYRILLIGDNSIEQTLITTYNKEKNLHYKIGVGLRPINYHILNTFKNTNSIILG